MQDIKVTMSACPWVMTLTVVTAFGCLAPSTSQVAGIIAKVSVREVYEIINNREKVFLAEHHNSDVDLWHLLN